MRFKRRLSTQSTPNLIPMIDVVFQLVVFFMVSTTFIITPGISLVLPSSQTAESVAMSKLVITVDCGVSAGDAVDAASALHATIPPTPTSTQRGSAARAGACRTSATRPVRSIDNMPKTRSMTTEATDSTPRDVSREKETARTASPPIPVGRKLLKKSPIK